MGKTFSTGLLTNGVFQDSSNNIGIGAAPSGTYKLEVTGTAKVSGALTGASATFGGNLSITGNNFFTLATTNTSARIGEYDATNRICFTANQNSSDAQDDATKPSWGLVFNANSTDTAFIGHKAAGGGSAALISLMTIAGTGGINIPVSLNNSNTGLDLTNSAGSGYGNAINFYQSTTKYGQILCETNASNTSEMYFKTMVGSTVATRLFISSAGNVGIGTSSPDSKLQVAGSCKIDSALTCVSEIVLGSNGSYPVGGVGFRNDGTNLNIYYGANNCIFKDVTNVERMRITSTGEVLMNTTNILTSGWLCISVASNNYNAIVLRDTGTTYSSGNYYQVFTNSTNGVAGGITHPTATTVSYYTGPSDQRLKSNIKDWTEPVLPLFSAAKPKTYNHIADEDESIVYKGFLAQDMVDNFPEAYGKDKEGYYTFNPSGYIPYLVKAIQEQQAMITSLQDRLDKAGL